MGRPRQAPTGFQPSSFRRRTLRLPCARPRGAGRQEASAACGRAARPMECSLNGAMGATITHAHAPSGRRLGDPVEVGDLARCRLPPAGCIVSGLRMRRRSSGFCAAWEAVRKSCAGDCKGVGRLEWSNSSSRQPMNQSSDRRSMGQPLREAREGWCVRAAIRDMRTRAFIGIGIGRNSPQR